jgi:hypothetical protein
MSTITQKSSLFLLALLVRFSTSHGQLPLLRGGTSDTQEPRSLMMLSGPGMALSSANEDNTVTVTIRQALFGAKCGSDALDPQDLAWLMFAVYQKPETEEKTCDFHLKKDSCWSTDVIVACDAETNQATVDLYTRDPYHLNRRNDQVENPKVPRDNGMCIGPRDIVGSTVKHSATFNCAPKSTDEIFYGECETDDNCPSSQWCSIDFVDTSQPAICKDYATPGEGCRAPFLIPPLPETRCEPDAGVECVMYTGCIGGMTDPFSRCVAYEGDCTSNIDCDPGSYCSTAAGQCMARFQEGDCCHVTTAPCVADFECVEKSSPFGSSSTCGKPDDGAPPFLPAPATPGETPYGDFEGPSW